MLESLRLFRIVSTFQHLTLGLISHCPKASCFYSSPSSTTQFLHLPHMPYLFPIQGQFKGPLSPSICPESRTQLEIKFMQPCRLESCFQIYSLSLLNSLSTSLNLHYPAKYSPQCHTVGKQPFLQLLCVSCQESSTHIFIYLPSLPNPLC